MMRRRAFILPVALAVAAMVAVTVIFCAGLLRKSLAEPERAVAMARAEALYGLDAALAQLQAVAHADTTATANAQIKSTSVNGNWLGAWEKGNDTPVWLVSGTNPDVNGTQGVNVDGNLKAPEVTTATGSYAYAVEDMAQRVTAKIDRLGEIPAELGENVQRLRQQTVLVPLMSGLNVAQVTKMSYGLLTNPVNSGWKIDLDNVNETDEVATAVRNWRGGTDLIRGRPIIWAEAAVLLGVYKNAVGVPQLGLAFWADAWNPYIAGLPFNAKGVPDLRLRLEGPSGTVKYFNASGALVGFERLDIGAHTLGSPVLTDLFGPMDAGEVRFITHYRVEPISTADYPDAITLQVSIPAGEWNFVFETLDGQPIQRITGVPFDAVDKIFAYAPMTPDKLDSKSCQWVMSFKLREPIDTMMAQADPRGKEIAFRNNFYTHDADPVHAQTNFASFSGGDTYRGGQAIQMFDLPEGSVISIGALNHMAMDGVAALGLGGGAADAGNAVFDKYFASSAPATWENWNPGAGTTLPNANLRLTGTPSFNELKANAAQYLLVQGAFNINTPDVNQWLAVLPRERYKFPFRTQMPTQPAVTTDSERAAWAQAIVARLNTRAKPWRSLQELAAENILPPDVFCRVSALLQPRGDTLTVHVVGKAQGAQANLTALVQRLPTPDGNGRRFQVLEVNWTAAN